MREVVRLFTAGWQALESRVQANSWPNLRPVTSSCALYHPACLLQLTGMQLAFILAAKRTCSAPAAMAAPSSAPNAMPAPCWRAEPASTGGHDRMLAEMCGSTAGGMSVHCSGTKQMGMSLLCFLPTAQL